MASTQLRGPALEIVSAGKRFGDFWALRGVSLRIEEGEFVCFLGPSGCGKTTLLRLVAGLERPDEGRIVQRGRDVTDLPPSRRDFGIVFQSYALFPNLTVRENVAYGLQGRGLSRAEVQRRVLELLELVGLPQLAGQYPAQLSGGQQQRVALARALATSPGLLLLDEPLSALDARVRQHLRGELRRLHRRLGLTTIMVTHDQEEALTLADRIVVMNHGVIEQVGSPREIYETPASAFVADFVGHSNKLAARWRSSGLADWGGLELVCPPAEDIPAGADVTLLLRPEHVAVEPAEASEPMVGAGNRVAARVQEVEFLGPWSRLQLEVAANRRPLMADVPSTDVTRLGLAPERPVRLTLPVERLRLWGGAA